VGDIIGRIAVFAPFVVCSLLLIQFAPETHQRFAGWTLLTMVGLVAVKYTL
jgi:hypothetical protein